VICPKCGTVNDTSWCRNGCGFAWTQEENKKLASRVHQLEIREQIGDNVILKLTERITGLEAEKIRLQTENQKLSDGLAKALDVLNDEMQGDDELLEELQALIE